MLRRHRYPIAIGVSCIVLAVAYGALAPVFDYKIEWAGVTMLFALGIALGLMAAVLDTGSGD